MTDRIGLKWGTLKFWHCESDAAQNALQTYFEAGPVSMSAAMQQDTDAQKAALYALIDVADCETVYLDWDGKDVSKEDAKRYIMEYNP